MMNDERGTMNAQALIALRSGNLMEVRVCADG
jgi:hypothetical protein